MASRKGFEPLTYGLGNRCSILLSYRDTLGGITCSATMQKTVRDGTERLGEGWVRACAVLLAMGLVMPAKAGSLTSPGCMAGGAMATVRAVDEELHVRLDDGRVVQMPGLDPDRANRQGSETTEAQAALERWLVGAEVRVALVAATPDRWGRIPALVFAAGLSGMASPQAEVSVSEAILEAGLARARPDPSIDLCWARYLTLEREARQTRSGVWANPFDAILDPKDRQALEAHLGRLVLVEGQARELHEGRSRLYVRLADQPGNLAITIERRAALRLAKQGADPKSWAGRRLRVRGFLDDRWGMQIDVTSAQQIELLGP